MEKCKFLLLLIVMVMIYSCHESMNKINRDSKEELILKMKQGDIEAYNDLRNIYLDYKPESFIPIAKYMADSLSYKFAYVDIFEKYIEKYNISPEDTINLDLMNDNDRLETLKYFEKAKLSNVKAIDKYKIKSKIYQDRKP